MQIVQYVPNNIKRLPPMKDRSNPLGAIGDKYNRARTDRQQRKKNSKKEYLGRSISDTCSRCKERLPTILCMQCKDLYCPECCYRATSVCQLLKHTLLPSYHHLYNRSCEMDFMYCKLHGNPSTLYCKECFVLICQECSLYAHKQHQYTPINGAYEKCCLEAFEIVEYAESNIETIKNEIDRITAMINSYEEEAADVKTKIKESKRCHDQAIKNRQTKSNELSDYMTQLQGILAAFGRLNESLVESMDAEGTESTTAEKSGRLQVEYFTAMFHKMRVTEERVAFVLPNNELMEHLKWQSM
ncbi:unnamed protein product [Diatraea saccharalis]|uniref:B box-type domain-containing protein n=1 Tax=Diatraea saccharalis TaxID=40085 RepID=A0A9P1B7N5_9NEOP|nr:unnamed protein product [Diatraea saccharalis]